MRFEIRQGPGAGTTIDVGESRFTIGREQDCDLVLADDEEVSRHHAYLAPLPDGRCELGDLGSRNGTFVGGTRVTQPVSLQGGEEIRVGNTVLAALAPEAAPAEAGATAGAGEPTTVSPQPTGPPQTEASADRGQSRIGRAASSVRKRMPGGRRDDSVDRRVQSAVRRALAEQRTSTRRLTYLAGGAIAIAILAVVLAVTGVFSSSSSTPSASSIVNAVRPSVVDVLANVNGIPRASGTGWVYDAGQGLIVTNAHVIGAGDTVTVMVNGQSRDATVVGASPCYDLAVLKVADTSGLTTLPIGSQADLQQGDTVFAIGFPGNFSTAPELQVTGGVVSVVQEQADLGPASGDPDLQTYPNVVQTSAAINHGNSGGPLVDEAEELVGVNTLTDPKAQNQGYAIGADLVQEKVPQLAAGNSIGWAGFDFIAQGRGLVVKTAIEGTSAAENGLGKKPVILTNVNGQRVGTRDGYCNAVKDVQSGDQVDVSGFYATGLPYAATLTY